MLYLICPSNYYLMPYLENYIEIIKKENIDYRIIYWNRKRIDEEIENSIVYEDKKESFNRSLIDYLSYYRFIKKTINFSTKNKYIIFSPQLFPIGLFIKDDYILDVRDYHKFVKLKFIKRIIKKAEFVVVSSHRFMEFIYNDQIYINHNFNSDSEIIVDNKQKNIITILNIGAIRDYQANADLISIFSNKEEYQLQFHGDGPELNNLKEFVGTMKIKNVTFSGRYTREEEGSLYETADIINLVRDNIEYNNIIALPNRLYKAAKYNAMIITTKGTALNEIVGRYKLGLSIDDKTTFNDIDKAIKQTINSTDLIKNQKKFLNDVINENSIFIKKLKEVLKD